MLAGYENNYNVLFQEQIEQEFAGTDQITEEDIAEYTQVMSQIRNLAKYEVKDAKKDEGGNYTVKVKNSREVTK